LRDSAQPIQPSLTLAAWVDQVLALYGKRILLFDPQTAAGGAPSAPLSAATVYRGDFERAPLGRKPSVKSREIAT
jgi:hypothetical protein